MHSDGDAGIEALPFNLPFIRWADVALLAPGAGAPFRRRLYDHEFVYVLEGRGHIVLEGQAYEAVPERLFLVQPRVWHSFLADCGEALSLLGVHFDWTPQHDTLLFPIHRAADEDSPVQEGMFRQPRQVPGWNLRLMPFLDLKGRPRVRRALEEVVTEYARDDAEAKLGAGALLAAAILQIAREARSLSQRQNSLTVGPDALRRLEQARALLEAQGETPLSIEQVAARVGWTADHLRRIFRQVLGTSPVKIQTAARIRWAKEIMRRENPPISEVAHRCGFVDSSHFARVFRKESGLSPRQFLALTKQV